MILTHELTQWCHDGSKLETGVQASGQTPQWGYTHCSQRPTITWGARSLPPPPFAIMQPFIRVPVSVRFPLRKSGPDCGWTYQLICVELSRFLFRHWQLPGSISDKCIRLSYLKHGCGRAGFDPLPSQAGKHGSRRAVPRLRNYFDQLR